MLSPFLSLSPILIVFQLYIQIPHGAILESVYYRYLYFQEDGTVLYALTSSPPHEMFPRFRHVLLRSTSEKKYSTFVQKTEKKLLFSRTEKKLLFLKKRREKKLLFFVRGLQKLRRFKKKREEIVVFIWN